MDFRQEIQNLLIDADLEKMYYTMQINNGLVDSLHTRLSFYMVSTCIVTDQPDEDEVYQKLIVDRLQYGFQMTLAKLFYAMFWPKK